MLADMDLKGIEAQREATRREPASRTPSARAANSSDVEECSAGRPAARVEETAGGVRRRDPPKHGVAHFCWLQHRQRPTAKRSPAA